MSADAGSLVHGLVGDQVAPDWPVLTDAEVRRVLARWPLHATADARVRWRSPRPQSAAAIVSCGPQSVFVKRHDLRVRDESSLRAEHRFAAWLRARGVEGPQVLTAVDGSTVLRAGESVYEVHALAAGGDAYRDAPSWTGFRSLEDASAAGAALARLHLAAGDFEQPARPFGPLVDSSEITSSADPTAALHALVAHRPGLAAGLHPWDWELDVARELEPALERASVAARGLQGCWTHGDWHPSNLTWSDDGRPVAVLDLGLSNRTFAVRDLALAIERACVSWLDAEPAADLEAVRALLTAYAQVRHLDGAERAALGPVLAVVHVEFALSEVEYYAGVLGDSERAALAYRDYLLGHARWFASPSGERLLGALGG